MSHAVEYKGFKDDISYFLKRARLFVLPSLWGEGCPTSILESYAWGIPVIAYNIDGIPELVSNGNDGFTIKLYEQQKFSECIILLLRNIMLANKFSENARMKITEKFLVKDCVCSHSKYFKSLLKN